MDDGVGKRVVLEVRDQSTQTDVEEVKRELLKDTSRSPTWNEFSRNEAVKSLLRMMVEKGVFTLNHIKRGMKEYLLQQTSGSSSWVGMIKPNGLEVKELFRPDMFESGDKLLPASGYDLVAADMGRMHIKACDHCRTASRVEGCYFYAMQKCISHGWKPRIDAEAVSPVYLVEGNYRSIDCYDGSSVKEFEKAKHHNIVKEVHSGTPGIVSPMGAVIKNSDKRRAVVLTGIRIVDFERSERSNGKVGIPALKGEDYQRRDCFRS